MSEYTFSIRLAKENFWTSEFGVAPKDIWEFDSMYDSLNLSKAKFKLRSVIDVSLLIAPIMVIPCYFLLRPLYLNIDGEDFIWGYFKIVTLLFITLEIFNRKMLASIVYKFDKSSFIFSLSAAEMIFLKKNSNEHVVHSKVNSMVNSGTLSGTSDCKIKVEKRLQILPPSLRSLTGFTVRNAST